MKKNKKTAYILATVVVILAIAISIIIPVLNNKKTKDNNPIEVISQNGDLPKLESFQNLFNMALKLEKSDRFDGIELLEDSNSVVKEVATNEKNEYSETNIQVEGVEEADIVKTDGMYIYYVSNKKIVIVNAQEPSNLKVESEIKFEGEKFEPNEIYIGENKLIVIGSTGIYNKYAMIDYIAMPDEFTIAKEYNIENKAKPKFEREVKTEGYYVDSRMINNNLYLVSTKNLYFGDTTDITKFNEENYKPKYIDTAISNEKQIIDFKDICYFPETKTLDYLTIASFNITSNEQANIKTYLGAGDIVYSSENNLYVAKTKYEYKSEALYGYYDNYDIKTYIYKFKIENNDINYNTVGEVPGKVLNQFSMDENNGYFRIATTDDRNENTTNNLYILNNELQIIGKVENLAKGERIYSVRFMQNKAYIVTFKETDPLFVIDLSKPEEPMVLGKLKIPGFSTYLHPYDETHTIGFGEETKETETGVTIDGIKMALFDVSDPINPKEMFKATIGNSGTYSELLYNHKALLFSRDKNLMAFPITVSEKASNYRSDLKFQGAMIYNIDLEKGFILRGTVGHMQIEEGYADYELNKAVERIIYIGNNIFTLSRGLIKVTSLETMDEIGSLEIQVDEEELIYIEE